MLAGLMSLMLVAGASVDSPDPCSVFDTASSPATNAPRSVTGYDLATLVDIGRSDPYDSQYPFEISPDGTQIAFVTRQGNPASNLYCQKLLIVPLSGEGEAREVDRGGKFLRQVMDLRNLAAVESGIAQVNTPHWSNDGRTLAYLKRVGEHTQIWTIPIDTGSPVQATFLPFDVEDFRWARDGSGFIVSGRPELAEAERAIDKEARGGFLFDARFSPMMSDRPYPIGNFPSQYFHVEAGAREMRPALPGEIAAFGSPTAGLGSVHAGQYSKSDRGHEAWIEKRFPAQLLSPRRLRIRWRSGQETICEDPICARIRQIGWSGAGRTLYFLARTGWAQSETSLYRWEADQPTPSKVMGTEDALIGCIIGEKEMICAREASRQPRRIVAIDLKKGRARTIFDPNPLFLTLHLGTVQRFRFQNAFGVECYADLVLPPNTRPGDRHPLVVVQYNSQGFLRGGTGDEVPIQLLAARGFAVLSFQRPFNPPGLEGATSELDYRKRVRRDWIDRRSVQSALEGAVAAAIATGKVDGDRMGISGFSEGTSATQWALINSRLFKVAALGMCCEDKVTLPLNGGIGYEKYLREMDYSLFEKASDSFWAPLSLAQNVDKIDVPILVQDGDQEYEAGLDVLQAFRSRGKPIELHVFPGEPHIKWQPAHRLAMYERVSDWFDFWLQQRRDCASEKEAQYARWQAMRGAPGSSVCRAPTPVAPNLTHP